MKADFELPKIEVEESDMTAEEFERLAAEYQEKDILLIIENKICTIWNLNYI